jgi:hypothetical protein
MWIVLEIYPMENLTNIRPIRELISNILGKDENTVEKHLQIGRIYGMRSKLVHHGDISVHASEFLVRLGCLSDICKVVINNLIGKPYQDELDIYFEEDFCFSSTKCIEWVFDKSNFVPEFITNPEEITMNLGGTKFGLMSQSKIDELRNTHIFMFPTTSEVLLRIECNEDEDNKVLSIPSIEQFSFQVLTDYFVQQQIPCYQCLELKDQINSHICVDHPELGSMLVLLYSTIYPNIMDPMNYDFMPETVIDIANKKGLTPYWINHAIASISSKNPSEINCGDEVQIKTNGLIKIHTGKGDFQSIRIY